MSARKPTRAQVIAALEVILEALREGVAPAGAPLVAPTDSRAGRACSIHLRELVRELERGEIVYRCPVPGCRERVAAA